jgi:hypothetical protein
MKKHHTLVFAAFIGVLIFQCSSCKGPQPCKATITVFDSAGVHPMAGVAIHLSATVVYNDHSYPGDLVANGTTNESGQLSFTIKNPCILDVTATVPNCTSNSATGKYCSGTGMVKFDEGKTNSASVFINQ